MPKETEVVIYKAMDLETKFSIVNQVKVEHPDYLDAMNLIRMCHQDFVTKKRKKPLSAIITGESGLGKTTIFENYINQNAKTEYIGSGTKHTILWATVPKPVRPNFLMSTLLKQIGDEAYSKGNNQEERRIRLTEYIKDCGVELIMLDEFQHFVNLSNLKPLSDYADWFKMLINETEVPIILFGIETSLRVLESNKQLQRRFKRRYALSPFKYQSKVDVAVFKKVLKDIESQLPFDAPSNLEELSDKIYLVTKGIMDNIMTLISDAAYLALEEDDENITMKHLFYSLVMDSNLIENVSDNPFK